MINCKSRIIAISCNIFIRVMLEYEHFARTSQWSYTDVEYSKVQKIRCNEDNTLFNLLSAYHKMGFRVGIIFLIMVTLIFNATHLSNDYNA
jgi:hypothetical protein